MFPLKLLSALNPGAWQRPHKPWQQGVEAGALGELSRAEIRLRDSTRTPRGVVRSRLLTLISSGECTVTSISTAPWRS